MRELRWTLAATVGFALSIGAGCSFEPPSSEGTQFSCVIDPTCPAGFSCVDGVCRSGGPDAAPGSPDARPAPDAEPGAPDAGATTDAIASGPLTVTFGERSTADHRGVTTDTYLASDATTTTHGSDGRILVDGSPQIAGLLRFDLAAIPAGSTVVSAELEVVVPDPFRPYGGEIASAHVLRMAWSEAAATWAEASSGVAWPTSGATGTAVGATAFDGFAPQVDQAYTIALDAAAVQAWVDAPATNFGLRVKSTGNNNLQLESSEAATDSVRPLLRVTYRPR